MAGFRPSTIVLFLLLSRGPGLLAQQAGNEGDRGDCDSLCIVATRTISFETTEGTQMNLDVSPDGQTILFDLLGDLYTVPRGGGDATRLTNGPALDLQPVFSPDGDRILFVSDRSGNENLWVVDADGSNPRPVTEERGDFHFADPEWSPEGDYILVRRNEAGSPNPGRTPWLIHATGGQRNGVGRARPRAWASAGGPTPDSSTSAAWMARVRLPSAEMDFPDPRRSCGWTGTPETWLPSPEHPPGRPGPPSRRGGPDGLRGRHRRPEWFEATRSDDG